MMVKKHRGENLIKRKWKSHEVDTPTWWGASYWFADTSLNHVRPTHCI